MQMLFHEQLIGYGFKTITHLCTAVIYFSKDADTIIFLVVLMLVYQTMATFYVHHVYAIHYYDSKNITTVDCETINLKYGAI